MYREDHLPGSNDGGSRITLFDTDQPIPNSDTLEGLERELQDVQVFRLVHFQAKAPYPATRHDVVTLFTLMFSRYLSGLELRALSSEFAAQVPECLSLCGPSKHIWNSIKINLTRPLYTPFHHLYPSAFVRRQFQPSFTTLQGPSPRGYYATYI